MALIAAIVLGGTGLGLQVKGQHEAGKAAQAQAKSESAWQDYNAKIAEREATSEQAAAASEERKQRKAGERLKRRRITQAGKAGIAPDLSFGAVQEETASELEFDALTIRRGGSTAAAGLTSSAQLSRLSGKSALLRGKAKRRAANLSAVSTGISGASQLAFAASE